MRSLPTAVTDELNAEIAFLTYIVEFEFDVPVYYTNADMSIYYDGKTYTPRGLDFGALEYSITPEADKVSLTMDNSDGLVSGWIMTSEIRGKNFNLWLVALDNNMQVIGEPVALFVGGLIDGIKCKRESATIEIFNHMILWKKKIPGRMHQGNCTFVFKNTATCKYAGVATHCDKSYDQCVLYGNTLNFGGFRWIQGMVDKQIPWGRKA